MASLFSGNTSLTIEWGKCNDLWVSAGDVAQSVWNSMLSHFDYNEFNVYVYGITLWTMFIYWTIGLLYVLVDFLGWPKWMHRYKVQPGTNEPVDLKRVISVACRALFNQIIVGIPFAVFGFYVMKQRGKSPNFLLLPTFGRIVTDLLVFIPVQEVVAYSTHRLFHHRLLYKHMHKVHHEWTAPIAWTAFHNHPLDHLIGNILPAVLGPALMNSHVFTTWLWLSWTTFRTLSDHSGYHLPGFPSPEAHDFHHLKFNECFGVWGIVDYLVGTDKQFRLQSTEAAKQFASAKRPNKGLEK